MRYYETLYIIRPDYEEKRLTNIQENVDQWVSNHGGQIINSYIWGKRKLAYPIGKQQYGTYMLLNFETESPFTLEFSNWMELHEAILANLTTKLEEKPEIREESETVRVHVST